MPRNNSEEERLTEDEIARRKLGGNKIASILFTISRCSRGEQVNFRRLWLGQFAGVFACA